MAARYGKLVIVYAALLGLLALTIGASLIRLGMAVNIVIAFAKAGLIFWFFMELRASSGLVRLFAFAGGFWLSVLFGLGLVDWLTR